MLLPCSKSCHGLTSQFRVKVPLLMAKRVLSPVSSLTVSLATAPLTVLILATLVFVQDVALQAHSWFCS